MMRENPFTAEWTIYAQNRENRPYEFVHKIEGHRKEGLYCPFCKGNEESTPEVVYQDKEDWTVRVFPNRFPVTKKVVEEGELDTFYGSCTAVGSHEVLVDTPNHNVTIDLFSKEEMNGILGILQKRYKWIKKNKSTRYIQIFKNCGSAAGMSMQHSHWQIVSLPRIPARIEMMALHMKEDNCLMCQLIHHEKELGSRVIGENEKFIAITPYASRFPYEVWICPKEHYQCYDMLGEIEISMLGELLQHVVKKVVGLKEDIGYNICFMDGGIQGDLSKKNEFHWHLEILPRIGGFAGFELATHSYINFVLPEIAKKKYDEL